MELKHIKPNYGRILLAGLIDASLIIAFFVFLFKSNAFSPIIQANPNLSLFIGFILYRLITITLFNSTLGMRVFNLIFLNADEKLLSLKEKLLASIFILFRGVDYYREVRSYI